MTEAQRPPQRLTDSHTLRALAHPVRLALLDAMRREGELTATRAAELLGESPGNMSWHLQTLAKYGFVEETGTGKGRSRPWRAVSRRISFDSQGVDPEAQAAGEALELAMIERTTDQLQRWRSVRHTFSDEWQAASYMTDSVLYLDAAELEQVSRDVSEIYSRYDDRDAASARAAGQIAVRLSAHGHPLV